MKKFNDLFWEHPEDERVIRDLDNFENFLEKKNTQAKSFKSMKLCHTALWVLQAGCVTNAQVSVFERTAF